MTQTESTFDTDGENAAFSPSGVASASSAFKDFYRQTYPRLVQFASARNVSRSTAEDIAMDTMIVIWRNWSHLTSTDADNEETGYKRAREYAFGVVKKKLIDTARQAVRYSPVDQNDPVWHRRSSVSSPAPRSALLDAMETSIALSDRQLLILNLHLLGFTATEISKKLGLQESTTRTHLASARKSIREALRATSDAGTSNLEDRLVESNHSTTSRRRKINANLRAIIATLLASITLAGASLAVHAINPLPPADRSEYPPVLPTDATTPPATYSSPPNTQSHSRLPQTSVSDTVHTEGLSARFGENKSKSAASGYSKAGSPGTQADQPTTLDVEPTPSSPTADPSILHEFAKALRSMLELMTNSR